VATERELGSNNGPRSRTGLSQVEFRVVVLGGENFSAAI
jgi:hypothetical protein